jgi:hypothetical protein
MPVAALIQHRMELIARKLPGLNNTPMLAAGQQVVQILGLLVAEQLSTTTTGVPSKQLRNT